MAKKKQKKEKESKFEYSNEILGILLILTSIIGIGAYGPVGNFIKSFIVFYIVVLLFTLFIGGYLILKRQMPKLLTARLLGIYIIFLSLLIFLHTQYVKVTEADVSIIKATFDNVMLTFNDSYAIANCGGGMIGAIFSYIFNLAFKEGTIIVVVTMALLGLMLTLNTSIIDLIKKIKFPKIKHKDKEEKSEDNIIVNTPESPDKEEEKEPKVVISSVEELTHLKEKEPEKEEPPKEEVQAAPNTNYHP